MKLIAVSFFFALFAASGANGPTPQATADPFPATGGDIRITPLIHASVQIEHAAASDADDEDTGDLR
jgi:hypothetical protein